MAEDADLADLDATAQADLVRSGRATPAELVDAAIERVERLNPELNAVIHTRFDDARKEAAGELPDGPFRGVPIVFKDLDGTVAGQPYHAGTRFLKERSYVATSTSELQARLLRAGFVCIGRTNTPEFGLVTTTEPEAYGPTRNPWDTERSTGGSSGGSAASVAAGLVPVAHAGDGGGSIRIPASECGLVGLKPSRGRVPVGPEVGEAWHGLVARLVVSRTVRDTAAVLDAVHGPLRGDPYQVPPPDRPYADEVGADPGALRIGLRTAFPGGAGATQPECIIAVEQAGTLLESLGHHVEEAGPEALDDDITPDFITAFGAWTAREVDRLGELTGDTPTADGFEAGTWAVAELGRAVTGAQYLAAIEHLHAASRRLLAWWEDFDVLVTPTIPEVPPTLGQFRTSAEDPLNGLMRASAIVPFTAPFNITGQPALSLPLAQSADGLPIGVQFVADAHREDVLLRLAAQLEAASPWAHRRPAIHA